MMNAYMSFLYIPNITSFEEINLKTFKLSLHLALKKFDKVCLITDDQGARILDKLPFSSVDLSLNNIPENFKKVWSLGKLFAYKKAASKGDPFVHIDHDVLLFNDLPSDLLKSPLIAFTKEKDSVSNYYRLPNFINSCKNKYYFDSLYTEYLDQNACYNMSIFGGTDVEFIDLYASEALKLIFDPKNVSVLVSDSFIPGIVEQVYLTLLANIFQKKVNIAIDIDKYLEQTELYNIFHLAEFKYLNYMNSILDAYTKKYNI